MTVFLYELSHHQPNPLKSYFFIPGAPKSPPFTTDVGFPQVVTNNVTVAGIQHFQTSSLILLLCDLARMLKGGGLLSPSLSYNPRPMSLLSRGLPPLTVPFHFAKVVDSNRSRTDKPAEDVLSFLQNT